MGIFRKRNKVLASVVNEVPEVPADEHERAAALTDSLNRIEEVQRQQPKVDRLALKFQRHLDRNHFIEKLEISYGNRTP